MEYTDSLDEEISGVLTHSDGLYTLDDDPYYDDSNNPIIQESFKKNKKVKVEEESEEESDSEEESESDSDSESDSESKQQSKAKKNTDTPKSSKKFKFKYPDDLNGYYVEIYKKENWSQPDRIYPITDTGNLVVKIPRKSKTELLNFWIYHECHRVVNLEMFVYLSEKYTDFNLDMAQSHFTIIPDMIFNKIYYNVDYNPELENQVLKFIMNHLLA